MAVDLLGFDNEPPRGYVVVVTGGRDFQDAAFVNACLDWFHDRHGIAALFHGAANGVDSLCGSWAWDRGIPVFECKANWKKYPKSAGPIRNHWMKDFSRADYLLAFPGKRGTQHMTEACVKKEMHIMTFSPEEGIPK